MEAQDLPSRKRKQAVHLTQDTASSATTTFSEDQSWTANNDTKTVATIYSETIGVEEGKAQQVIRCASEPSPFTGEPSPPSDPDNSSEGSSSSSSQPSSSFSEHSEGSVPDSPSFREIASQFAALPGPVEGPRAGMMPLRSRKRHRVGRRRSEGAADQHASEVCSKPRNKRRKPSRIDTSPQYIWDEAHRVVFESGQHDGRYAMQVVKKAIARPSHSIEADNGSASSAEDEPRSENPHYYFSPLVEFWPFSMTASSNSERLNQQSNSRERACGLFGSWLARVGITRRWGRTLGQPHIPEEMETSQQHHDEPGYTA